METCPPSRRPAGFGEGSRHERPQGQRNFLGTHHLLGINLQTPRLGCRQRLSGLGKGQMPEGSEGSQEPASPHPSRAGILLAAALPSTQRGFPPSNPPGERQCQAPIPARCSSHPPKKSEECWQGNGEGAEWDRRFGASSLRCSRTPGMEGAEAEPVLHLSRIKFPFPAPPRGVPPVSQHTDTGTGPSRSRARPQQ